MHPYIHIVYTDQIFRETRTRREQVAVTYAFAGHPICRWLLAHTTASDRGAKLFATSFDVWRCEKVHSYASMHLTARWLHSAHVPRVSRQRGADILGTFWPSGRIYVPPPPPQHGPRCLERYRLVLYFSLYNGSLFNFSFYFNSPA